MGFDFDKLLKGEYKVQILAGQHIMNCDYRLLREMFAGKEGDKVPQNILYKTMEFYGNLTSSDKQLIVAADNLKITLNHSHFDKVWAITAF